MIINVGFNFKPYDSSNVFNVVWKDKFIGINSVRTCDGCFSITDVDYR